MKASRTLFVDLIERYWRDVMKDDHSRAAHLARTCCTGNCRR